MLPVRDLTISLAQFAPRLGDVAGNLARHVELARAAAAAGSQLVVFPELSLTGYLLRDLVPEVAQSRDSPAVATLLQVSRELDLVVGLVEEAPGHRFHNAAAYLSAGVVSHIHRKLYLPTYGLFQEGRDFAAGDRLRGFEAPFGPCGMLICEDLWHQTSAWLLAEQGAEVLIVLTNGPVRGTRPGLGPTSVEVWSDLARVTARFLTCFVVCVNRTGCEDGLTFGGGSLVVDPFGEVVARLPVIDEALETVTLDGTALRRARATYPLLRDSDLELVRRELERIRQLRYELPAEDDDAPRRRPRRRPPSSRRAG